jgi:hypothetical protein
MEAVFTEVFGGRGGDGGRLATEKHSGEALMGVEQMEAQ